ncbi:site-specific DNA-methyltransferase [Bosea sp. NBC_00550]|uniref:site-specific DNA-methyltransferase n=1 Tax=Bosea sp. NBC_00550 TaxID=2969621 RepID=UPI002231AD62|nr:DNA methyltransferase [Bosea sp. NBC_00550]UZF94941.1 site-specific DNA-methyltransferase [Bosea sp. NBC_00550]
MSAPLSPKVAASPQCLDAVPVPKRRAIKAGLPPGQATDALYRDLQLTVEHVPIASLKAYKRALRRHPAAHIEQLLASIRAFGLVQPILIDRDGEIVGGHGLLEAARKAGYLTVPVIRLGHLDEVQQRTLRIALNGLAEKSAWDRELLALEFGELLEIEHALDLNFGLEITGFASAEIDQLIESAATASCDAADDVLPDEVAGDPVSRPGDLWLLGDHRLICGDARDRATYAVLLGGERAAMGIHDAPYDVPISGHVAKPGKHREFVMGSGELGSNFIPFLTAFLTASTAFLVPGGYQYCFMDWRHIGEMLAAGHGAGLELKNLCVWNKGSGAMGSLYRSQHELVFVFKDPGEPGTNNVQLGKFGRNRTNVWDYPGATSLRQELKLHPTPKNVAMIADALRDVTQRNEIVLDAFSGSGTTIIACAKVGRRAHAIELDPHYVDVGVRRWETWSGGCARHAATGLTFAEIADLRLRQVADTTSEAQPIFKVRQRSRQVA